jgi:hypothetical protein
MMRPGDVRDDRQRSMLASGCASGESARRGYRWLSRLDGLRIASGQALAAIVGNGAINDRAAVNALPCVEDQKEVGEPLEHHEPFALRTFHRFLPGCDVHSCGVAKQEPNQFLPVRNFNMLDGTYLLPGGLDRAFP